MIKTKTMKTKMMIVLAMLFSLQSFGQTVGQIFASGGINYRITSGTTVEVAPTSITGVISIPANVSYNNTNFTVTSIGDDAFAGNSSLGIVSIPNSVTIIGARAFKNCRQLISVSIPNSVTSIGNYAFERCWDLTSITIPNSVTTIGEGAFQSCDELISIVVPNSVTSIGVYAFSFCDKLTSVTIPSSVSSISAATFQSCPRLISINFPNSVTSIGTAAFQNCISLTSVTIPNSVLSIGRSAFSGCSGLTSAIIPNSVTSIGDGAFSNCSALTSFSIPNSITNISAETFQNCTSLTAVSMPTSVLSIGRDAFQNCLALKDINISASVLNIGLRAFDNCRALKDINIPASVTGIGARAFSYCNSLISVTANWSIPLTISRDVFDGLNLCNISLNVPSGTEVLYDATSVWTEFAGSINFVPPIAAAQTLCGSATVADLVATGHNLQWYNSATSLAPLLISTAVTSGIYYVSQTGCSESTRTSVTVTIINTAAPTAVAQTLLSTATVANLVAIGANLQWYDAQTGGTSLTITTPLATGTYYVSQTINNCESPRTAVAVTILPQYTAIPDSNFEQALFDKGIDTVIGDNRVLTAAIINIPTLDVSNKGIADLTGIEAFYALTDLNCRGNFLTSLNITTVVLLQKLNCSENQIASLNLSNQTVLQLLRSEGNLLTTINTTGISTLLEVYCSNNLMTTLDFTAQTNLQKLYCNNNRLTNLNVTGLTQLNQLGCNNNQLANLNVSNASLSLLNCGNNLLTNIDFRFQEPTLTTFNCQANRFSQMDLRGYNQLSNFNCTLNPNLSCISVDDVAYANANYQKDATASFSPNCFAPIVLNYCRNTVAPPLVSPFAVGVTSRWYTTAVGGRATLRNPTPTTTTDGTRVYYVSQVSNGVESARIAITVNTLGLPGTPGAITGVASQGALVGTTTAASYSVAPVADATSYNWTVPAGVNIVSGQGTTTLTVNFSNVPAGVGSIGNLMVVAVNDLGCSTRAARILALTKALPAAPTAIRMTDAALAIPASGIPTAVTNISRYIGQPTVLTLTARPVAGVTTYEWELPAGVNVLSGAVAVRGGALGGNVITVNFEGVTTAGMFNYTTTSGILTHVLRIGVRSITGVGASTTSNARLVNPTTTSTARLLTLTATAPRASSSIRMTDAMAVDPTKAITVVSTFIGTPRILTLTATPVATANQYNWELPAGVKQLSGGTSNVITVNFADVPAGTTSLYLGVKAVNGAGESVTSNASLLPATNSTARLLRLSATVPGTVPAVTGQLAGLCGKNAYTYTISPSALATSYEITAPLGSIVTSKGTTSKASNVIKTSDLEFTVVYPEKFTTTKETPASITVAAVNGVGKSAIARTLGVTTVVPMPTDITITTDFSLTKQARRVKIHKRIRNKISGSPTFVVVVNDGGQIVSGEGTDEVEIDYSKVPSTIKSTKVLMYDKNSCGVLSLPITRTIILEPTVAKTAETLTIEATEVYPNPVSSVFNVDVAASATGSLTMNVYSLDGNVAMNTKTVALQEGTNTITENVSSLAKGVYVLQLVNTSNNEIITKKLIKD